MAETPTRGSKLRAPRRWVVAGLLACTTFPGKAATADPEAVTPESQQAPQRSTAVAQDEGASLPQAPRDPELPRLVSPGPDLRLAARLASNGSPIDLFGLRDLVAGDAEARRKYEGLRARRTTSVVLLVGAGTGLLTAALLASAATRDAAIDANLDCALSGLGGRRAPCSGPSPSFTGAYVALGISGALGLIALAIWPRQAEVDGVAAEWRARHGADAPVDGGRSSALPSADAPRDRH